MKSGPRTIAILWAIIVLPLLASCTDNNSTPLPVLTYQGNNPEVQLPLSPADSLQHIQVPKGFEVSLFAAEPDIINPIAFSWDERGRLWVLQSEDYPHGLGKAVGGDRITICEDTNGDGRADKFTDFATMQSLSTGLAVVKGGVLVAQAPNIVFLEDTNGDDKFDKRTVILEGFGTWDTHAGPSNLRYGYDNKMWGAVGYAGFSNLFDGREVNLTRGLYRFSKDGSFFEPIATFNNNTWGLGFSEDFEIFGSTANNNHSIHVGIPLRHYDYLGTVPTWGLSSDYIQGHYEIHPVTDRLQQVDVKGGFTAAAGATFYTARNYPKKYWNQMLVNEPTGHLLHLALIEPEGAGFHEVDGGNLMASTDEWFSPVFADTGPDGNIWVADWYNPVIQHNPDKRGEEGRIWNEELGEGNAHINPLRDYRHGRIYILRYKRAPKPDITSLSIVHPDRLVAALNSDNGFWRNTAQRLVVEHQLTQLIPDLYRQLDSGASPTAIIHTLWTLHGLGAFTGNNTEANERVYPLLRHGSAKVRRAAIMTMPETTTSSEHLVSSGVLEDKSPQVRRAAFLRASELPESQALYTAMQAQAQSASTDKWLITALKIFNRESDTPQLRIRDVKLFAPSAEETAVEWRYTTDQPDDDWLASHYDDSNWQRGFGGFAGRMDQAQLPVASLWTTTDIWLRRTLDIDAVPERLILKIIHDDGYRLFINGSEASYREGYTPEYLYIELDAEAVRLLQPGRNVIALHVVDTGGDRYIDAGLGYVDFHAEEQPDTRIILEAVNQKMAFDKTTLTVRAGDRVQVDFINADQMPHNVVFLDTDDVDTFGQAADAMLKEPDAQSRHYVPASRFILAASTVLNPGEQESLFFTAPTIPGRYVFVCTYPGHWRMMQGTLVVTGRYDLLSEDPDAQQIHILAGGSSHNFSEHYGKTDAQTLFRDGASSVTYTESSGNLIGRLNKIDTLVMATNLDISLTARAEILNELDRGLGLLVLHASAWYNWPDWPEYNRDILGGGATSHEALQAFDVIVSQPDHPLVKGVPKQFTLVDELYRSSIDPQGPGVEVLAIGRSLETGEEYPLLWVVESGQRKIVVNTLGHDDRAHNHPAYKTLLINSIEWLGRR